MSRRDRRIALAGRMLWSSGLASVLGRFTQGKGIVFTLHRVLPPSERAFQPNSLLEITPQFLEETILQVRRAGLEFVSLSEATKRLKAGADYKGPRFVALTFDDGYRDNLDVAYPILKRHEVPFTVFITSGFCDRTSELWWVALERLIERQSKLVLLDGQPVLSLDCADICAKNAAFHRARAFLMHEVDEARQRRIIRETAHHYGLDLKALAAELVLSWEELRAWNRESLVSFGAHTVSHPALERLDPAAIHAEVAQGVQRMTDELGSKPTAFAYPYGFEQAADHRAFEVLRSFEFDACVTTRAGTLTKSYSDKCFRLPRVSLNGHHQNAQMVSLFLTGVPFVLYDGLAWLKKRLRS
ncbi:polysaccharide deacetylase family protein [Pseudovibrio exalbescens]|nr:polysaccharide deacetylase family protein [Pseudovibrio exalbescens]